MARLDLSGYDELINAFSRLADAPEEVTSKTLSEMEAVAADKIRESGRAYGIYDQESTVHVLDNIKMNEPKMTDTGGYADITFAGSRTRHNKTTRNAEIAFINEYGKTKQTARPFVGEAINKNADAIAEAGLAVLDWAEKEFQR